jgi:iron complex transport system ATP-binding protein
LSLSQAEENFVILFEIQNLSFRYPSHSDFQLNHTNLSIPEGSLIGLLGANGAGKSTILKLLAGLLGPSSGNIFFENKLLKNIPVRERGQKIAYVPQFTHFTFPLSVWEIVEMGRHPYLGRFQSMGKNDRAICEKALELCDVTNFKDRSFGELSGGEKQRVLLASALAQTPRVLLLDEPTLSLDLSHQIRFFEMIERLHREQSLTVVVATHELNLAGCFLNRLVLMKAGRVEAEGTPQEVLTPPRIKSVLNVEVERLGRKDGFHYFIPRPPRKVGKKSSLSEKRRIRK